MLLKLPRKFIATVVCASLFLVVGTVWALDATTFADQLVRLRAEVEDLSSGIEEKKADLRAQLRSTANQKGDLEMQIQRENLRLKQLQETRARQVEQLELVRQADQSAAPEVLASIETLRVAISEGLPFQVPQRLAELDKIEQQITTGTLSAQRASAQVWQIAENHLRLTRESGLYRQVIVIDGHETLAEVARLGMVAMYFMTGDGRVGVTSRRGDAWSYEVLNDPEDQRRVRDLFNSFKKQLRVGHFSLPNAFAKEHP